MLLLRYCHVCCMPYGGSKLPRSLIPFTNTSAFRMFFVASLGTSTPSLIKLALLSRYCLPKSGCILCCDYLYLERPRVDPKPIAREVAAPLFPIVKPEGRSVPLPSLFFMLRTGNSVSNSTVLIYCATLFTTLVSRPLLPIGNHFSSSKSVLPCLL